MHDIEPFFHWSEKYDASADRHSPFYGREYSEFYFSNKIYNYLIHPQWDDFGSPTLYSKILFVDYEQNFAIIEFIGEWNDCLHNDIMTLLENLVKPIQQNGICKFVLICENVLNFHGSDDCYYEEWHEELIEDGGWVTLINLHPHVLEEMTVSNIHYFANLHSQDAYFEWRSYSPANLIVKIESFFKPAKYLG